MSFGGGSISGKYKIDNKAFFVDISQLCAEQDGSKPPECKKLTKNAETAVRDLGIECEIEKVTDIKDIMGFGVMMTPALVIDGNVKVAGKVPPIDEIKEMLS